MLPPAGEGITRNAGAPGRSTKVCGTAIVCMPSCTTPTFSKIPVTSQLTQPATLEICQARGKAVATSPAPTCPWAHSVMPIAAVPTNSSAFITDSVAMKRVVTRMCAAIAAVCWSTTSRTYVSSSLARAKSLTVRMLV